MKLRHRLLQTSLHTTPETIMLGRTARRPLTTATTERLRGRELTVTAPIVIKPRQQGKTEIV